MFWSSMVLLRYSNKCTLYIYFAIPFCLKKFTEKSPCNQLITNNDVIFLQNVLKSLKGAECGNRTACIRHPCRKTTVFSCHRCLIYTRVEKWTTFKCWLEFWPPDVSEYKEILVFQQLFTFFKAFHYTTAFQGSIILTLPSPFFSDPNHDGFFG